ncbi:hypothetical protein OG935_23515 [Nocardia cyriacigeorgica]|uniref:hypothetical protein n=1 Tax=Nocardia cyriacigeorgica TaxID=135487 RepID=UPI001893D712|nr:hypothetical protein [Nocardia cyriacigeorgica]MBF6321200.1 hypothetical protein [Nocardia cyriacigeorgica]
MKPISDPPMVTVLAEPLRRLRSGLGSGAPAPDQQVLGALTTASATADATESTQTRGLHALESSWSGQAADTAVPVIRTTRSEIGAVADRGPQYAALLSDAHSTSSRAAREVDVIIDDFRRDARAILDTATSAPETDAVIDRAAQAIREALGVVNTAQGEMDGHRQRLRDMGPMTMTTPQGVLTTPGTTIPGTTTTVPGTVPGQPMDPALVMQLQLQQQLVAAGVQLGTTAIDAGVELGTKIIDRIADVGLKVVDTVGAQAGTAIEQALNPGKADNAETGPASTAPAGAPGNPVPPKAFDFGGGPAPKPETAPSAPGAAMAAPPPPPPRSIPAEPKPSDNGGGGGPFAAPPPAPGGHHGGMVIPPGTGQGGGDQERKPRPGQLGVTVPAALPTMVTAPAIGADDDR